MLDNCLISNNTANFDAVLAGTEGSGVTDNGSEICFNTAFSDHSILSIIQGFSSVLNNTYLHNNLKLLVNSYIMYFLYTDITFNQVTFSEENTSIVSSNILINQSDFKNRYKLISWSNKNRGGFLNLSFQMQVSIAQYL